jgi:nucleotide-binding universal stress UspA family protein
VPERWSMFKLDEFASVFRSADKARYTHADVNIRRVALFTDIGAEPSRRLCADARIMLSSLDPDIEWVVVDGGQYKLIDELLEHVERIKPDLICAYRNLHGRARRFAFSLGGHVDVLTQATSTPVVLLPDPTEQDRLPSSCENTDRVMVLTDHLTGSDNIVAYGTRFTEKNGHLVLAHLENDHVFERYISVISKIPSIDTEEARLRIRDQLLKEPTEYIRSCRDELARLGVPLTVHEEVTMGHHVAECQRLIKEHAIDLVVMNSKDDDQLAMHGLAYPLAVEIRNIPLLLLLSRCTNTTCRAPA